jgi:hypothetical protein
MQRNDGIISCPCSRTHAPYLHPCRQRRGWTERQVSCGRYKIHVSSIVTKTSRCYLPCYGIKPHIVNHQSVFRKFCRHPAGKKPCPFYFIETPVKSIRPSRSAYVVSLRIINAELLKNSQNSFIFDKLRHYFFAKCMRDSGQSLDEYLVVLTLIDLPDK